MSLFIQYDSTFEGFLSVVFEVYRQRLAVGDIRPDRCDDQTTDLFMQHFWVETNQESARRIKRAIVNAASGDVLSLLMVAYRSEDPGIEMRMLAYLRKLFSGIDPNYGKSPTSEEMLPLYRIAQSVRREAGDMRGMVRFSKLEDGTYFSEIEPKYDIIPLMTSHFRGRFANERWAIYDSKRNYGIYYDGSCVIEVAVPDIKKVTAGMQPDETTQLWKDFYKTIAIKERENPKLLKRCLPVRYWRHMPEREASPETWLESGWLNPKDGAAKGQSSPFALPSETAKANSIRRVQLQSAFR